MQKGYRHIKITGILKSRGEYLTASLDSRPYEAVTFTDEEGEEIHFYTLVIPKRLDENIKLDQTTTFYVFRFRNGPAMVGVLYAIESDGEKFYYEESAIPLVESLALERSWRNKLMSSPSATTYLVIVGVGLNAWLHFVLGVGGFLSFVISFGSLGSWLSWPVLFTSKRAGLPQMKETLSKDGFVLHTPKVSTSKY